MSKSLYLAKLVCAITSNYSHSLNYIKFSFFLLLPAFLSVFDMSYCTNLFYFIYGESDMLSVLGHKIVA